MSEQGAIFTAGPPVVRESLGETVSKEDLGGPDVAVASGLIHNVAPDDDAALDQVRQYLSFFPRARGRTPERAGDRRARPRPELLTIIPRESRRVYDMRRVIDVSSTTATGSRSSPASARR